MLFKTIILFIIFVTNVYSNDIPIITITAPSKKPQSVSTVGTSLTILDEKFLSNSTEHFLGDVLNTSSTSANFFQSGGHGTASAIQLRGMPKKDILPFILMVLKCLIHQVYQVILILIIF